MFVWYSAMSSEKPKKSKGLARKRDKVHTAFAVEPQERRQHKQLNTTNQGQSVEQNIYPSFKSHAVAPWVKGDPERDDKIKIKEEYQEDAKLRQDSGRYGKLIADERDLDYIRSQKDKEEYLQYLKMSMAIVDPEKPETVAILKRVAPEVVDLPEKNHRQSIAFQRWLRTILTNGIVEGEDDHKFMYEICRADTYLPVWPIWDPMGDLITQIATKIFGESEGTALGNFSDIHHIMYLRKPEVSMRAKKRGIFNPVRWSRQSDYNFDLRDLEQARFQKLQLEIKKSLFRKIYRGLKYMKDEDLENEFINKPSVLTTKADGTPEATEDSAFKLFDWAKNK